MTTRDMHNTYPPLAITRIESTATSTRILCYMGTLEWEIWITSIGGGRSFLSWKQSEWTVLHTHIISYETHRAVSFKLLGAALVPLFKLLDRQEVAPLDIFNVLTYIFNNEQIESTLESLLGFSTCTKKTSSPTKGLPTREGCGGEARNEQ